MFATSPLVAQGTKTVYGHSTIPPKSFIPVPESNEEVSGSEESHRSKMQKILAQRRARLDAWKQKMIGKMKAAAQIHHEKDGKTPETEKKSPDVAPLISSPKRKQEDEAGPSNSAAKKVKYFQEPRTPPYVPPEWMSEEVKQYYKYWSDHADEVRKFIQDKRVDRPRIDGSVPFVLQHALELKERKIQEDKALKRSRYTKEPIKRTEAQKDRDFHEWRMIQSGENLRMQVIQLHRNAVAKELGIPVNKVTRDIGQEHGIPYGPFKLQKKSQAGGSTSLSLVPKEGKQAEGPGVSSSNPSKKQKGKEPMKDH